jgi:hypothetical protein
LYVSVCNVLFIITAEDALKWSCLVFTAPISLTFPYSARKQSVFPLKVEEEKETHQIIIIVQISSI